MKRFEITAFGVPNCNIYFKVLRLFEDYAALNAWLDEIDMKMPADCYYRVEEL